MRARRLWPMCEQGSLAGVGVRFAEGEVAMNSSSLREAALGNGAATFSPRADAGLLYPGLR